jgi:hypothetical protein
MPRELTANNIAIRINAMNLKKLTSRCACPGSSESWAVPTAASSMALSRRRRAVHSINYEVAAPSMHHGHWCKLNLQLPARRTESVPTAVGILKFDRHYEQNNCSGFVVGVRAYFNSEASL